jgi:ribosomal protein S12 methylthiotransferase accessory factor
MYPDKLLTHSAPWACGINIDRMRSRLGCIFEAIERYCSAIIPEERLLWASESDLRRRGYDCMPSEVFDYFTEEQYAQSNLYDRWKPESKMRWVLSHSLTDGRDYYMPAQLVYCPYTWLSNEIKIFDPFSTGLAAHRTLEKAIYSGLCEVVERDSFMIFWHNMLPSPHIRMDSIQGKDSEIDKLLYRIRSIANLEITFKDLTTDINIPTPLCILRNRVNNNVAAAAFAAASDLNPIIALRKAINECLGTYMYANRLRFEDPNYADVKIDPSRWDRTIQLDDHVVNFAHHEIHDYIKWVEDGDEITFDMMIEKYGNNNYIEVDRDNYELLLTKRCLRECVERLARVGLECIYTDVTSEDIALSGFHVVHALIPGVVPLNSRHPVRPEGCKRYISVPDKLGLNSNNRINVVPHPYP